MFVSPRSSVRQLLAGVAISGSIALLAGSALAYTSTGGTTVTGSNYQANSQYAQAAGVQGQPVGMGSNAAYTYQPATQPDAVQQPAVQTDNSVYTGGYTGPMGPNAQKAFEVGQQQPVQAYPSAQPVNGQIVTNPQQIQSCLCLQTRYEMLNNDRSTKDTAYQQAVTQRADLDMQIATAKAAPYSPEQVEHIRELSARRIELQHQINQQYIPEQQESTERYNSVVDQYQQSCAARDFDSSVVARVKTGLVCQGS